MGENQNRSPQVLSMQMHWSHHTKGIPENSLQKVLKTFIEIELSQKTTPQEIKSLRKRNFFEIQIFHENENQHFTLQKQQFYPY